MSSRRECLSCEKILKKSAMLKVAGGYLCSECEQACLENTGPKTTESTEVAFSEVIEEFVEPKKERKTTAYMTDYELCTLISARAIKLRTDFPSVKVSDFDPLVIATKEILERKVDLIVRRTLTDGSTEDWSIHELIFPRQ